MQTKTASEQSGPRGRPLAARAARRLAASRSALAARLAEDARYDLHALIELVERGCAPELAVRILAPLEDESAA